MDVIVHKKHQTGLEVSILPEEKPALLPTAHLSDHVTNCSLMWAGLQEGVTISNAVCLSRNKELIVSSWARLLLFSGDVDGFEFRKGFMTAMLFSSFSQF